MGTTSGWDGDELFDGTEGGYIAAIHSVRVKEVVVDGENGVGIAVGAGFVCSRLEDEDSGRHGNARLSEDESRSGKETGRQSDGQRGERVSVAPLRLDHQLTLQRASLACAAIRLRLPSLGRSGAELFQEVEKPPSRPDRGM